MDSTLDHDDSLGGTTLTPAAAAVRDIYARIARMRPWSRIAVGSAAWLIRRVVLSWPGLSGAIACAQVWAEIEASAERRVSPETRGTQP